MREFEQAWTLLKQESFQDIMNQMLAEDPHHYDDISSYLNDFGPEEMRQNLANYLGQATSLEDYKNRLRETNDFINDEYAMRRDVQGEPLYDRINDFESGDEDYYDAHIDAHEHTKEEIARRDRGIAQFPEGSIYVEPDEYLSQIIEEEKEADKKEREQANALTQFQQLNRGESMKPFEQAWAVLKADERMQARSYAPYYGSPSGEPPGVERENLGTVDPNALSMMLRNIAEGRNPENVKATMSEVMSNPEADIRFPLTMQDPSMPGEMPGEFANPNAKGRAVSHRGDAFYAKPGGHISHQISRMPRPPDPHGSRFTATSVWGSPQMKIDSVLRKLMSGQQLTDEEYQYLEMLD